MCTQGNNRVQINIYPGHSVRSVSGITYMCLQFSCGLCIMILILYT
jgi:hypothetical protein